MTGAVSVGSIAESPHPFVKRALIWLNTAAPLAVTGRVAAYLWPLPRQNVIARPQGMPKTPPSLPLKSLRRVLALAAIAVLASSAVYAQENLDAGKSPQKLFSDGCAACHRSPRGLAKGRFSFTLYLYLQQHYASNSSSAWALTSYLEAVDAEKRGVKRAAASPPPSASRSSSWSSSSSPRPPASIPNR